jgi:hypothetical protein
MNDAAQAPDQNDQSIGMAENNQVPKFKHHVKKHWPKVVSGLALLLLVAIGFTLLTKPETKPGEAVATRYNDVFGIGGFAGAGQLDEFPRSLHNTNVKMMRAPMSWNIEQPTGDDDPINNFDGFAEKAQDPNGDGNFNDRVKVLGVLAYTPAWARTPGCSGTDCEPRSAQEFATWAGKMAEHYKQYGIHDWEIWNEPNNAGFWNSNDTSKINPQLYANLVMKAFDEIRNKDSSARVIIGATSPHADYTPDPDAQAMDPRAFIQRLYDEAANQGKNFSSYYTALSHHPYAWSQGTSPQTLTFENIESWYMMNRNVHETRPNDTNGNDVIDEGDAIQRTFDIACPSSISELRSWPETIASTKKPSLRCIMQVYGASAKKIWVTEYGSPTGVLHFKNDNGQQPHVAGDVDRIYSEDVQIGYIREAMERWKTYPWAGNFYVFRWADNAPYSTSVIAATHPDVQVRQGLLKKKVNVSLADDAPVNAFGCTGSDGLTPTGRAKKAHCWIKQKLDDPLLGGAVSSGLRGQYYPNETLSGTPSVRDDSDINFVWGSAPITGVPNDGFSVRWTGKIRSTTAGTYRIRTYSDDGVRLWIGGTQKISNWTVHSPTYNTTTVSLNANTQYNIRLEHFDRQFGARIQLQWDTPGGGSSYTTIPSDRFSLP